MDFPIAIYKDANSVYGVTVPDVAGCYSAGETIEDAIRNARDAITTHVEALLSLGEEVVLEATPIETLQARPEYAEAIWALADVDTSKLDARPERINISLPRFVLHKIDAFVERRHETRSGFLARVALDAIASGA
ncbi:type II toxin-antitoxin system HicB family antitoxin [Cupriavidus sp. BIS7]|uniref:type II toxin-antitoxin system HicB family antitoxin n=1 Tax=Cupriavidus sp. BIS7 TaxID=1217718 RepID=UPI0002D38EE3|nr:type II toxin-antitoxin system HicB family antitoxin [Cupriavidus sp. BIS7]